MTTVSDGRESEETTHIGLLFSRVVGIIVVAIVVVLSTRIII